ncbi:MAG TPA: efflux transporter outer membrane subunit [Alphaproteobacteria bacterium]|nr:efflux transporter outer membrane subunit [Alphaproteobacteria bacterium]
MKFLTSSLLLSAVLTLAACEVGPDYVKPSAPVSASFKEGAGNWLPAKPSDDMNRGMWWIIYKDPALDLLERQVEVSNQNLKASEAAYRQAVAVADQTQAQLFPTLALGAGSSTAGSLSSHNKTITTYNVGLNASWTPDVWGRIRRQLESDEANAQASAADLASAKLSAQATLAADYFELRIEDEMKRILDAATEDDRKSLEIVQNQYEEGVAAKADVLTASTQLESVRAQAINTGVQRAQLEHAIAVLIGKPPGDFSIAPSQKPLANDVPLVPTGVPSALLERRPDIASNERQMAAANAEIGVAVSAYFPDITLAASLGYQSPVFGRLLNSSNSLWSFGPSLSETIFDAGARDAAVEEARAAYDQAVANYRQTVLTAFQQVEDNLASLKILAQEAQVVDTTVASSKQAEVLTLNQYKAGTVPYSSVLVAQNTTLSNQQSALTVYGNRLVASVGLIQALGGGWDAGQLPK